MCSQISSVWKLSTHIHEDPVSLASGGLQKTTRTSPHHVDMTSLSLGKYFNCVIIVIIIIITTTMFMVLSSWQSHCESSPGSSDECRMAPSGRRPKTKPDNLGCESACTCCQKLHPPPPFIIITQPESWYSFYRSSTPINGQWTNHRIRWSVALLF